MRTVSRSLSTANPPRTKPLYNRHGMSSFTFLHLHTHFSALGGPASPADWCRAAAALGYKSLGIADRGPLAGLPSFALAARQAGIQPVSGMEIEVLLPSSGGAKKQPVALFARDTQGLESLGTLASVAYAHWPNREEAVTWEGLARHAAGLVLVLLACEANGQASAFVAATAGIQAEWGGTLKGWFGEAAFVGLPHSGRSSDDELAAHVVAAAGQLGLPLLATPAARYIRPEDAPACNALAAARRRAGWKQGEIDVADCPNGAEYLKSPDEAAGVFAQWPQAVENVARVAQMCSGVDVLDLFASSQGQAHDEREQLQRVATERLLNRLAIDNLPSDVQQRLQQEVDALSSRGLLPAWSALATMGDVLQKLRNGQAQVPLGAPLGAADGSLLAYALGVSPLNPVEYAPPAWLASPQTSLPATSHLPPPGVEVPDSKRDTLLAAISREYGPGRTALAACPIDIDPLTAVWAARRVLGEDGGEAPALALQAMSKGWEVLVAAAQEDSAVAKLALSLQGSPLLFKPDSDTLLIAPSGGPLPTWLPVLHVESTQAAGWVPWAEETVARIGFPAMTLRPSASLSLLDSTLHLAAQYPVPGLAAEELNLSRFPGLSAEAIASIGIGESLGIPYLSAAAFKGWKGDFSAENVAMMVAKSMGRGKPPAAPTLDVWAEKTASTGGSLLYRDQFDAIAQEAAGLSPHEAATLRRTIAGKDAYALTQAQAAFAERCAEHGLDKEGVEALWRALSGCVAGLQSRYAAASWGRVAAWVAHLKAAHPAAFMAALLGDNITRAHTPVPLLAAECLRLGVPIKAPNADYSLAVPSLEREGAGWAVLWGLAQTPGWSRQAAERFIALRPKGGFAGISDLMLAAVDADLSLAQMESLVRSGGCDTVGGQARSREGLLEMLPVWLEWAQAARQARAEAGKGQMDMFALAEVAPLTMPDEKSTLHRKLSPRERYLLRLWEEEHLGAGFTEAAEIEDLNKALEDSGHLRSRLLTSAQLTDKHIGKSVYLVGLLTSVTLITPPISMDDSDERDVNATGATGDRMALAWVEDREGTVELVAFPPSYKRHAQLWTESSLVTITARVRKHADGALYLLCEHLAAFHGAVKEAEISITVKQTTKKTAAATTQQPQAKPAPLETAMVGAPSPHGNGANGASNIDHTGSAPTTAADSSTASTSPAMISISGESTSYKLTITLPVTNDDRADIDHMIALKELLSEHPGPDPVTLRIPYNPDNGAVTTAQLPHGVAYSTLLEAQIVSLLSPQAVEVSKL